MQLSDSTTLGDARAQLRRRVEHGERCPCCTQFAKVYRRKINRGIARALIAMYQHSGTDWLHKPTVLRGLGAAARDESISRYWGLTEDAGDVRDDGGHAGYWRVTEKGEAWLFGRITVPRYARIYDTRCLSLVGEPTSVEDALGEQFDLEELMTGVEQMLDAARDLADLGYPVFPCKAGGKMPLVAHGFKQATRDERTILHWWDRWPDANVAIACGAAGIAVVDIDARHGADPAQVIAGLPVGRDTLVAAWTGVAPAPSAQNPESLEGLRGMHLLFRDDSTRTGPLATDGVELRAVGSYVIAPPSLHPSGVRYAWHRRELPPRPQQLPPLPPALRPRDPPEKLPGAGALEHATYAQGRRHQAIRDIAVDLLRKGIVAPDLLGGALRGANLSRCQPPLPDDELRRIIAWASQSELAQRAHVTSLIVGRS